MVMSFIHWFSCVAGGAGRKKLLHRMNTKMVFSWILNNLHTFLFLILKMNSNPHLGFLQPIRLSNYSLLRVNDADKFRLAHETSFVRDHTSFWTKTPIFFYVVRNWSNCSTVAKIITSNISNTPNSSVTYKQNIFPNPVPFSLMHMPISGLFFPAIL